MIGNSVRWHAALHSFVADGVELLHTIETTEHQRDVMRAVVQKHRHPGKRG